MKGITARTNCTHYSTNEAEKLDTNLQQKALNRCQQVQVPDK